MAISGGSAKWEGETRKCIGDRRQHQCTWDFKALRIAPTHYTIRTFNDGPSCGHLKSWAIEGSDDGASWTEINRRENNHDLNDRWAVKTFAAARSGSFHIIRLR
jgi:hypothetical protein